MEITALKIHLIFVMAQTVTNCESLGCLAKFPKQESSVTSCQKVGGGSSQFLFARRLRRSLQAGLRDTELPVYTLGQMLSSAAPGFCSPLPPAEGPGARNVCTLIWCSYRARTGPGRSQRPRKLVRSHRTDSWRLSRPREQQEGGTGGWVLKVGIKSSGDNSVGNQQIPKGDHAEEQRVLTLP